MYIGTLKTGSNRATYTEAFQVYDDEDSEGLDLTDATITVAIRRPNCSTPELTLTNDDGVEITDSDEGHFELTITATQMRTLCAMTYECGITIEQNDETTQYLIGKLPVLDGVVS
jgi:hypothetical protein